MVFKKRKQIAAMKVSGYKWDSVGKPPREISPSIFPVRRQLRYLGDKKIKSTF
jgi:hypothetical protein